MPTTGVAMALLALLAAVVVVAVAATPGVAPAAEPLAAFVDNLANIERDDTATLGSSARSARAFVDAVDDADADADSSAVDFAYAEHDDDDDAHAVSIVHFDPPLDADAAATHTFDKRFVGAIMGAAPPPPPCIPPAPPKTYVNEYIPGSEGQGDGLGKGGQFSGGPPPGAGAGAEATAANGFTARGPLMAQVRPGYGDAG